MQGSDEETETDEEQRSDCEGSGNDSSASQSLPTHIGQEPHTSTPSREQVPTATQYAPGTLPSVMGQPQQQQGPVGPLQSPGFPMPNFTFQQYPYTVGQHQTMNIPSFMHQQTTTNQAFCAPGIPVQQYPAQFLPEQNQQLFVPQIGPNGQMLNMMPGMVPAMHPGVPHPMAPMTAASNTEQADSNAPLDMSLSNRPRSVL